MGIVSILKGLSAHPLGKQAKYRAISGFIRWQLGCRLVPGPVLVDFVNNSKLLVGRGMTGATGNLYNGLHEFEDMAFLLHFLSNDDLFVDIGANVGSYTVLASSAIGARTMAFEPIPSTFDWLKRNVAVNGVTEHVRLYNMGVGSKKGCLLFTENQDTTNHVVVSNSNEESVGNIKVEVDTLDQFLGVDTPALIKIDVEGFETEVLSGAHRVLGLQSTCAVIMEINGSSVRYGYSDENILQRMMSYGFGTYRYDPFKRKLISLEGKSSGSGNTLFVKNVEFVATRLASTASFVVRGQRI